ncbi:MAG: hypothetical protein O2983_04870, partial [Planctomycetota bacterium]|nr:hypothetical protein [Planctomycetota bacterium]
AAQKLTEQAGIELAFDQPFFKEFTLECRDGAEAVIQRAKAAGFDIGPALRRVSSSESEDRLLVAVTECRSREEIDALANAIAAPGSQTVDDGELATSGAAVGASHGAASQSARSSARKAT